MKKKHFIGKTGLTYFNANILRDVTLVCTFERYVLTAIPEANVLSNIHDNEANFNDGDLLMVKLE